MSAPDFIFTEAKILGSLSLKRFQVALIYLPEYYQPHKSNGFYIKSCKGRSTDEPKKNTTYQNIFYRHSVRKMKTSTDLSIEQAIKFEIY